MNKKKAAEGFGGETRFIATALAVSKWRGTQTKDAAGDVAITYLPALAAVEISWVNNLVGEHPQSSLLLLPPCLSYSEA